jgi:hypothetical protein
MPLREPFWASRAQARYLRGDDISIEQQQEPHRAIYNVTERESSRHLRCYFSLPMETPIVSARAKREYVQAVYPVQSSGAGS